MSNKDDNNIFLKSLTGVKPLKKKQQNYQAHTKANRIQYPKDHHRKNRK